MRACVRPLVPASWFPPLYSSKRAFEYGRSCAALSSCVEHYSSLEIASREKNILYF